MMLKLNIVGRRRPGTTLAEHRQHIRAVHGEEVLRFIRTDPENAPRRYAQNRVVDGAYRGSAPGDDPFALYRDFLTQIWFEDFSALARSRQSDFYRTHLVDDEDRFVDQANVVFLPSNEREIVSRGVVPAQAWKLFVLLQRAPGFDSAAFTAAWSQAAALAGSSALRHVQNDVLGPPGATLAADAIDEFWFDEEAPARAQLTAWKGLLDEKLFRPGAAVENSLVALIAREDVLHAGGA